MEVGVPRTTVRVDDWFLRCQPSPGLVARRLLNNSERVEEAIKKCQAIASRGASEFDSEGAFRSWLLRALIDEACFVEAWDRELRPADELRAIRKSTQ